jgi:hypothetical protein
MKLSAARAERPSYLPRFKLSSALVDLLDPGLLDIRFIALFETVDQRGHQASALADRKLHRFFEQLLRLVGHAPIMPDRTCCRHRTFEAGSQVLAMVAALPVAGRDRKQLVRQLALRQTIETRALKRKLAVQRRAIQKSWHPGTWRQFVARRTAKRDVPAIRLVPQRERERDRSSEESEL